MDNSLNVQSYIVPFLSTAVASVLLTMIVRKWAIRRNIVDRPDVAPERKVQSQPIPLLGGVAIFLAACLVTLGYAVFSNRLLGGYLLPKYLVGIGLAGLMLMVGGYMDDRFHLKPGRQIVWPVLACLAVVGAGIGVTYITNPFGGVIRLDSVTWSMFSMNGVPYYVTLWADLFAFAWLMGMMYTTKFLDGLDGLVSGIGVIGSIILFFLSLGKDVAQPETALLASIFAGACLGFLLFNFHPAKIFLGEGGSLFVGFMLGTLSIISGAKIATALLIMGVPILDVAWVIVRRLFIEKKSPFSTADRKHLHFRLLDIGVSHRGAVLLLYTISLGFGAVALFSGTRQKLIALFVLVGVMVLLGLTVVRRYRTKISPNS
ncbi:MAG: MraY family glycosyltransferase [Patescibacteria group bacterium]|jgi:UDP-GlcNAc:undecaprenyl-phosphate GlcNAc-1-phosphate transferase